MTVLCCCSTDYARQYEHAPAWLETRPFLTADFPAVTRTVKDPVCPHAVDGCGWMWCMWVGRCGWLSVCENVGVVFYSFTCL